MRRISELAGATFLAVLLPSCGSDSVDVVPVASVQVSGPGTVLVGATAQFVAIPKDDRGQPLTDRSITWSSSDGSTAPVAANGLVTGVVAGQVTISASSEGVSGSADLTVNNPVPSVTATEPSVVPAGGGDFTLTVRGSGFVSTSVVRFDGSDRQTARVSDTELWAAIGASDVAQPGTAQIAVYNPPPGGGQSMSRPLAVGNPTPTVASVSPDHVTMGAGDATVSITGTGFVPTSVAQWQGEDRPTIYRGATALEVSLSAADLTAPGWRAISVSNPAPGGGPSGALTFAVRIPVVGPFSSAGYEHQCAVTVAGEVFCWGSNSQGQLGDGSYVDSNTPKPILPPTRSAAAGFRSVADLLPAPDPQELRFVSVAAGGFHTCALDQVGNAYCWGQGTSGQLGDGWDPKRNQAAPVAGGLNFVSLTAGTAHTCGLTQEGRPHCWGRGDHGQIGTGDFNPSAVPVSVVVASAFVEMSAGAFHTCGLTDAGSVVCWGRNDGGEIGNGTLADQPTPQQVPSLGDVAAVTLGMEHTCAVTAGGSAYCWGRNDRFQLGNDTPQLSTVPIPVAGGFSFESIQAGDYHNCGVTGNDEVRCWGIGDSGQLGTGDFSASSVPAAVVGLPAVAELSAGNRHTCALTVSGQMYCWGDEEYGQLGNGNFSYRLSPARVQGGPNQAVSVAAGYEHSCSLASTGGVYCWGDGSAGQLGDGSFTDSALPVAVASGLSFSAITAGAYHNCALAPGGAAYCWGFGGHGQLGNGAYWPINETTPVPVAGGHAFHTIAAGVNHTCGVSDAGEVLCWGGNGFGQLGNGSLDNSPQPTSVDVPPGLSFASVGGGYFHACGLSAAGEVWCWGANESGQLGDGTFQSRLSPVKVTGLPPGIVWLAVGGQHSCAIGPGGAALCWGKGPYLGVGSAVDQPTPQPVLGGHLFRSLYGNMEWTCGITLEGDGYCWGSDHGGPLGVGSWGSFDVPQEVDGGHEWSQISDGSSRGHTCGVTTTGEVYCWGRQWRGALGTGTFGTQVVPGSVVGSTKFGPPGA